MGDGRVGEGEGQRTHTVQEQGPQLFCYCNGDVSPTLNTSIVILKQSIGEEPTRPVVLTLWVETLVTYHIS